jgi:uncharacterized damage-inducible protein DinB
MTKSDIIWLYRFTDWANARLVQVATGLSPEAFERDLGGSFRTIRDVLAHIASADWVWLERWKGASPSSLPDWYTSSDPSVLSGEFARVAARRSAFFESLAEPDLSTRLAFTYFSGKPGTVSLVDALFHVVNHSTYHRGQLAWMLRQVGSAPPPTDFTVFKAESAW